MKKNIITFGYLEKIHRLVTVSLPILVYLKSKQGNMNLLYKIHPCALQDRMVSVSGVFHVSFLNTDSPDRLDSCSLPPAVLVAQTTGAATAQLNWSTADRKETVTDCIRFRVTSSVPN